MSISELEDIKILLHSHNGDLEKLKKVMSKIMANVYVGKDMSSLFPDIVLQVRVKDSSVNRLIGMFTAQYGHLHPDTALLCINQLTKDVLHDSDSLQRGHALQTLGSLNIPTLAEYIAPPIKAALQDSNQYVRRLAINGCVKIFNMNKDVFEEQLLACHLEEMTEDFDESVVVIAVAALVQVKPGYNIKRSLAMKLLKHLSGFSDWQVPIILSAIDAANLVECEEELMDIINYVGKFLDDCSSSVVLHVIKLLQYAVDSQNSSNLKNQFIECTKKPLLFRVKHSNPEISYMFCLEIFEVIPNIINLSGHFKIFFPAYYDPSFLKAEKLHVLASLITTKNAKPIVSELLECLSSPKHDDILKELVECIAVCVLNYGSNMGGLIVQLANLLQSGSGMMISTLLPFLENIVFSLEDCAQIILPQLHHCAEFDLTPGASVALISLLGSYGNILPECVSMFYCYVEEYFNLDTDVRHALLSAVMKQMNLTGMPIICKKLLCLVKEDEDPLIKTRANNYCAIIISNQNETLRSSQKHHISRSPSKPECFTSYPVCSKTQLPLHDIKKQENKEQIDNSIPPLLNVVNKSSNSNINLLDIDVPTCELTNKDKIHDLCIETPNSQASNNISEELISIFEIPSLATTIQHDSNCLPQTINNFLMTLSKSSIQPEVYEQNWSKNWKSEKFKAVLSHSNISISSDLQAMFSEHSISTMAITPPTVEPQQLFLYSSSAGMIILIKVLLSFSNDTLELEVRAVNHMVSQMMLKFIKHKLAFLS